jgi:hypothetical protein
MSYAVSNLRRYRGPVIILLLAATLIAALAIPRQNLSIDRATKPIEVVSNSDAIVKRVTHAVGDQVTVGEPLVVLSDPKLDAEINKLEDELKLAMLDTKIAVAEPAMTGLIGSLPRVVWETPEPSPTVTSTAKTSSPVAYSAKDAAPVDTAEKKALEKQADDLVSKSFNKDVAIEAANTELLETGGSVKAMEAKLAEAEKSRAAADAEKAKLEKLYDMGAIPKNKLDVRVEASSQAVQAINDTTAKLDSAKARQSDLEKQIAQLKMDLAELRKQLDDVRSKMNSVKAKVPTSVAPTSEPVISKPAPRVKPVKKIVYGTAPESLAPVHVNLVDAPSETADQRIAAIRQKLIELKNLRDSLTIRAATSGKLLTLVQPGFQVARGAVLATID